MSQIPRPRPRLMVIGDSLAQGCRSLTINKLFCAQSWPARIAQEQTWEFTTPDFPRPVLFDLEEEIRSLPTLTLSIVNLRLEGIVDRLRDNLRAWLKNDVESALPCFDNLGLAGALVRDLYTRSAASSAAEIAALLPQDSLDPAAALSDFDLLNKLQDLHLPINARFTLNPSQDPAFNTLTPLDWVRQRKPHLLVVQVGHNHGLYNIGAYADNVAFDQGDFWDQWQHLADQLAGLPAEIETILVALLPKVGAAANLGPQDDNRSGGYADAYEPLFSVSPSLLSGTDLSGIDGSIHAGNARIQTILNDAAAAAGTARDVKFLNAWSLFDSFDYKNSLDPQREVGVGDDQEIDNRYLDGTMPLQIPLQWVRTEGGFQSMDGMHASGCGYAVLASEAMNLLGLTHQRVSLLKRSYAEDPLLSEYPPPLHALVPLLRLLRGLRRFGESVSLPEGLLSDPQHLLGLLPRLQSIFTP